MPQPLIDLTGRRFGRLVVCFRAPAEPGKKPRWVCKCSCPVQTLKIIYGYSLLRGDSTSCGCVQRAGMSKRRTTHGRRRLHDPDAFDDRRVDDPTYESWSAMKTRCLNPNGPGYPRYGGRGITVCPRWLGPEGFSNFLADVGPRPEGTSLNRIDNAGNYCAAKCDGLCGRAESNCNWATPTAQTLNREHVRQFTAAEIQDIVDSVAIGRSQEWLARKYAVGRRVIRRVLRDAWRAANGVDLTRIGGDPVTVLIKTLRREGFPQPTDELEPITRVRRSKTTVTGDTIVGTGRAGQRTCLVAHPHRFEARHNGQPSAVEAFNDDALLARAIRYQLDCGDPTTPSRVLRALQAFVRAPQNFPPALARWLVDEYAPKNGTVLDPCAGFGGRLLGTVASTKNLRYVGFDIEARTVDGNNTLAERLGVSDRANVTRRDAVSPEPWPRADLVITSPPYFNLEDYGDAARAALPATYEAWRDGFLRALIANALQVAPVFVLNVAGVGKRDMPADAAAIVVSLGGVVARTITWSLPKFGRTRRAEKILVIHAG